MKNRKGGYMEKIIMEEATKRCKWYEKILLRIFKKTFIKFYHIGRIYMMNIIIH